MMSIKETVLNGLYLDASRPLHPLVRQYLSNIGCNVYMKDGYLIIDGSYTLSNKKTIFAELITLSKKLYGEVIFDLELHPNKWNIRGFEVVDKKPNQAAKIATITIQGFDQEIIDLIFTDYLLWSNAVVYLGPNQEICYLAGDEPLDPQQLTIEASKFIMAALGRMKIQKISTMEVEHNSEIPKILDVKDIDPELRDLLMNKFFLNKNCQIAYNKNQVIYFGIDPEHSEEFSDEHLDQFLMTEYTRLQNKGLILAANKIESSEVEMPEQETPPSPGMFAALSNWIFGGAKETSEASTNTPRPRP